MKKVDNQIEDFGKEFIKILPINIFQKIFKQIENFDGETPETLISKIKNKSLNYSRLPEKKEKSLRDKFLNAVRSPEYSSMIKTDYKKNIKFLLSLLKKDSRYSLLMKLVNKADKKVDFISISCLMPFMNLEQNFVLSSKPMTLLEKVNDSKGEKRKYFLVELLREIPEPLYRNYLECIWKLSYLAESKMFPEKTPEDLGELVKQSANRLKNFPNLVDVNMKVLRNSFVHKNFEYNLKDDSFIVWDKNSPKTKMTADEIVKISNDATLMCVETFPLVAQLYLLRNFFLNSGFLDLQLEKMPILFSENQSEVSKAEIELSAFAQLMTEPMRNFFQSHQ